MFLEESCMSQSAIFKTESGALKITRMGPSAKCPVEPEMSLI